MQSSQPTPRGLILDLLSTVRNQTVPVRALLEAAELFGIRANGLRVALARLLASGAVQRDERGRYRLAPRGVVLHVQGWRQLEAQLVPWSGGWLAVHTGAVPRSPGRPLRLQQRALRFLGLQPLLPGLLLRPANLRGGAAALRQRLLALGLAPEALVCELAGLDAAREARARSLWDAHALARSYRELAAALQRSAARLRDLPLPVARVESFRLGGAALRQLLLDPLLPEPLAPVALRRALLGEMRRYDRLGRAVWKGWLGEPGPASLALPVHGAAGFAAGAAQGGIA